MKAETYTVVCYGEILWDVLPNDRQPGGAPLNAVAMGGFIATKKGGCPQYILSEYDDFKNQYCDK